MKLSMIWLFDGSADNEKTFSCLRRELPEVESTELILYADEEIESKYRDALRDFQYRLCVRGEMSDAACYNDAQQYAEGELVTAIHSGDTFSEGSIKAIIKEADRYSSETIFMLCKVMPDGREGAFSSSQKLDRPLVVHLDKDFAHYPFYFGGTFVRSDHYKKHPFREETGLEFEQEYFLRLCMEKKKVVFSFFY